MKKILKKIESRLPWCDGCKSMALTGLASELHLTVRVMRALLPWVMIAVSVAAILAPWVPARAAPGYVEDYSVNGWNEALVTWSTPAVSDNNGYVIRAYRTDISRDCDFDTASGDDWTSSHQTGSPAVIWLNDVDGSPADGLYAICVMTAYDGVPDGVSYGLGGVQDGDPEWCEFGSGDWTCGLSSPVAEECGNGIVEIIDVTEECDDGNTDAADGCSATCQVEDGWTCDGEPSVCTEDAPPPEGVTQQTGLLPTLLVATFLLLGPMIVLLAMIWALRKFGIIR